MPVAGRKRAVHRPGGPYERMRRRQLHILLLAAAVIRFALLAVAWSHPERMLTPDSTDYLRLTGSLHAGEGFEREGRPEIFRTPGYPVFLLVAALFRSLGPGGVAAVQVLADVLLVYLTYLLASLVADRRSAVWAAAFQAVSVVSIVSSLRILSDGLYAVLFVLALCLLVLHLKAGGRWSLLSAAGVMGVACYVRPVGLVMAALMTAALLARPKRWRRAGAFAGVVLALVLPWVMRNGMVARYWGFSSFATDSMYFYAVPQLEADRTGQDAAALRARRKVVAGPPWGVGDPTPPPGPAARERARDARREILAHPASYAWLHLRGCVGVYLPGAPGLLELAGLTEGQRGTHDVLQREGLGAAARHYFGGSAEAIAMAVPLVLILALKYLAVAVCVVTRARRGLPVEIWLLVAVVAVGTFLPGPFGLPRYRVPLAPILSIAAGCGAVWLSSRLRRKAPASR